MGREDEIRLIAYSIWEEENCPDGCDCEHWFRAETIWEVQNEKASAKSAKTESKQPVKREAKFKAAKKKSW
jgi:Protein of unknown function (DUF2934)